MSWWDYTLHFQLINIITLLVCASYLIIKKSAPILFWFILFIVVFESVFAYVEFLYFNTNILSYNILSLSTIGWYFLLLFKREWSVFISVLFFTWIGFTIITYFNTDPFKELNNLAYLFGLTIVAFLIVRRFYRLIIVEEYRAIHLDYKSWLSGGILFFYFCVFPILTFVEYLVIQNSVSFAYYDILSLGNVLLSLAYLISVIVLWKTT